MATFEQARQAKLALSELEPPIKGLGITRVPVSDTDEFTFAVRVFVPDSETIPPSNEPVIAKALGEVGLHKVPVDYRYEVVALAH